MIRVGCCGFPQARARYFKKFNVVEIQQTLYDLPQVKTVARWRQEAGKGFEFTMKAWQLITHPPSSPTYEKLKRPLHPRRTKNYGSFQLTPEVLRAWEQTEEVARVLGVRLILFQCPPSFIPEKTNIDSLTKFFGSIERNDYLMVWEPQGRWPEDLVVSLCKDLNLIHCTDPFVRAPCYGFPWYLRLHGRPKGEDAYTDEDLEDLKRLLADQDDAYVLFNNANMLADADRFRKLLR